MRRALFALLALPSLAACAENTNLDPIARPPLPEVPSPIGIPRAPALPVQRDIALPSPRPIESTPKSCGDAVFNSDGYIIDMEIHDGRLAVATTAGLWLGDPEGGFRLIDTDLAWRLRSGGDALYVTTSTDYTWDSFSLLRFDSSLERQVLLDPADLAALGATYGPTPPVGAVAHSVVADFAAAGSQLVFTAQDTALVDHQASVPTDPRAHLFTLATDGSSAPLLQASMDFGGELALDGTDVFIATTGVERFGIRGWREVLYSDASVSPQRVTQTSDAVYVTSAINGAVVRVEKASGDATVLFQSEKSWAADVIADKHAIYWLEVDFSTFPEVGRVVRAGAANGEQEVVTDCIVNPGRILVHDGDLYVSTTEPGGSVIRVRLP